MIIADTLLEYFYLKNSWFDIFKASYYNSNWINDIVNIW